MSFTSQAFHLLKSTSHRHWPTETISSVLILCSSLLIPDLNLTVLTFLILFLASGTAPAQLSPLSLFISSSIRKQWCPQDALFGYTLSSPYSFTLRYLLSAETLQLYINCWLRNPYLIDTSPRPRPSELELHTYVIHKRLKPQVIPHWIHSLQFAPFYFSFLHYPWFTPSIEFILVADITRVILNPSFFTLRNHIITNSYRF